MKVLMVITSHDRLGDTGRKTGFWLLVEDEMLRLGAIFSKKADWAVHVVSDGLLITGQNPASSGPAAKILMTAVTQWATPAAARAS
jgi:putative intracellular protease/amidase